MLGQQSLRKELLQSARFFKLCEQTQSAATAEHVVDLRVPPVDGAQVENGVLRVQKAGLFP
jgi:hypothetical protein